MRKKDMTEKERKGDKWGGRGRGRERGRKMLRIMTPLKHEHSSNTKPKHTL